MPQAQPAIDDVFRALSDPTRRRVLERLCRGPASVSELAAPFAMKLPSFVQHLGVLEDSRLVSSTKSGRTRIYRIVPQQLTIAEDWFAEQRRLWETRLDQLEAYLHRLQQSERQP
jgi:DNA-binding transcriptional ArsR family regulator